MQSFVTYSLRYKILNLRDTKASRHDMFQNNSTTPFSYTPMNVRKANLSITQEIELTKNTDHCRASWEHPAGR
jgi:hypothetical protein